MGLPYSVTTSRRTYLVIDDLTTHFVVFVTGRLLAAEDSTPLAAFSVTCPRPDIFVKTMEGGYFCLAGNVAQVFPQLNTQPYNFTLTISASRFRSLTQPVVIPTAATFPIQLADIALVAEPIRIQGRTTLNASGVAVPAARIMFDDANIVTLRTPLHFDQSAGQTVNPCTVTPDGVSRSLTAAAAQGATSLLVDVRSGLAAGSYLRLGVEPAYEYVRIAAVPGNLAQPGEVRLDTPLRHSATSATAVTAVSITAGTPARSLSEDRLAGESLLRLSGAVSADHIEIIGSVAGENEIHALGALSDAQGYYRLDGVSRVRNGPFLAHTATVEAAVEWLVDYRRPVNNVDFRLRPP
jgi:hypothetical protein